jgi:hypothetical protein
VLQAFPEGGRLVRGLENGVFLAAAYPDGSPAPVEASCVLRFLPALSKDEPPAASFAVKTGENGLGEARFRAESGPDARTKLVLEVSARDARGNEAKKSFDLSVEPDEEGLRVVPDRSVYKVGETMRLTILSTRPKGLVYLDFVKDRQTVLTKALEIEGGKGTFALDVAPDLFGLVDVHAYQIRKSLSIVRDARRVFVSRADDLAIDVSLDKETYLPAQKAILDFQVKDAAGRPVAAALGLYIVDEAVFALSELRPGLEKVFFLLEQEILKPRVQLRGIESDLLLGAFPREASVEDPRQQAARALFSITPPPDRPPVSLSSREEEMLNLLKAAARKIWAAMQERAKAGKGWPEADLSVLVKEGSLKAEDLLDPWGNPYEREGCTCQSCRSNYLRLRSAGPDGKKGTSDDVGTDQNGNLGPGGAEGNRRLGGGARPGGVGGGVMPPPAPGGPVPAPNPTPTGAPAEMAKEKAGCNCTGGGGGAGSGAAPAVRIREFFPETLLVRPELLTDENGRARQEVDLADSITSWRLSAFASSAAGALGSVSRPVRVFQDFFADVDFPVELTQNDEVSVPVAVYNYLQKPQTVRLAAEPRNRWSSSPARSGRWSSRSASRAWGPAGSP